MNRNNPLLPFALIMFIGLILITFLSLQGVVGVKQGASEEDKDPAVQLYQDRCGGCHGDKLQGSPIGPALTNIKLSEEEIESIIVNGKGEMAGGFLTGEDARTVTKWLASKNEAPTPDNSSDEFAKIKDTYKTVCQNCHGEKLQGVIGPSLVKSALSDKDMIHIIVNGKGSMPKNLVDENTAKELVRWIHTQK
ncbi:MAG: cytochrome [Bacillales bacterium]|jgi:mono/diheme cytochrome c family protein|nr:cytochrome [Bacillales bacterium]